MVDGGIFTGAEGIYFRPCEGREMLQAQSRHIYRKNKGNEKLAATFDGTSWTATVGAKNYSGKDFNNIVVFFDAKNNPAYSLVDFGSGPIVMCYDNSVTNFF